MFSTVRQNTGLYIWFLSRLHSVTIVNPVNPVNPSTEIGFVGLTSSQPRTFKEHFELSH